jgi:hypothetical protein
VREQLGDSCSNPVEDVLWVWLWSCVGSSRGEIIGIKQGEEGPDEENKGCRRANLIL